MDTLFGKLSLDDHVSDYPYGTGIDMNPIFERYGRDITWRTPLTEDRQALSTLHGFGAKTVDKLYAVKPHMTKVTCFLLPQACRPSVPLEADRTSCLTRHYTLSPPTGYAASAARKSLRSDRVQVLLFDTAGTFASSTDLVLSDFSRRISRM